MIRFRTLRATILVLLAASVVGFAWWQHVLLVRAQADLARARALVTELARKPVVPPPEVAPVAGPAVAESAVAKPLERDEGAGRGRPGRFARVMADLASDPEIGPLMLNQRKRAVATRYAALLARLGLPVAQTDQLKALLAEKQLSHSEAQSMARSQGLGRDEAQAMARQADAESDAAIRALLGDNGFAQLQEFDRTSPQRATVGSLVERLGYAGAPLPVAQQEQLIQILATNATSAPGARGGDPLDFVAGRGMAFGWRDVSEAEAQAHADRKAASDAEILRQASGILTPAQVATLRQMQQEEDEQLRLNTLTMRRLRQVRGESGG